MDRRTLLKTGGMGILGLGLGGCFRGSASSLSPYKLLPPLNVAWNRVIHTTVGLRPHRPSGFVLRAEQFGDKTLIHNYGHGGSGMSLSWGTGSMAADLALESELREVAVIGCGVAGLTTARQLQRRGFSVTIYALSVPPDTTSNMSLAAWTPTSGLVDRERRTAAWDLQLRQAARIAYRQLQLLSGPEYGISWIDSYALSDSAPRERSTQEDQDPLLPSDLRLPTVALGPGEHPFPTRYASQRVTLRIEPSIYLDALVRDVMRFGGRIVIRKFDTPRDLMTLDESIIINCTGLGSHDLFGDTELVPLKGQLTLLVPQPEVNYATFGGLRGTGGFIHMQPRSDGIALGGTSEEGNWSLEPDENARQRIVEAHRALFAAMRGSPSLGPAISLS
ncbi:MAG: FAD-dependent oxidoreductase [Longimicrobiales bacterium]|nr:FAD-dependent oxidoreductase [Longimicrobiales bacterium]